MTFREALGSRLLFCDGAMGTMLQAGALAPGEAPEWLNERNPDAVQAVHEAYLKVGANIISSNTFGANRQKCGEQVGPIIRAAVDIARRAVRASGREAFVALDIGPTGKLLKPFGELAFDEAYQLFAEMIACGQDGCDLILIETMADLIEVKAAVLAAKEMSQLPIVVTMSFDEGGRLLTGGDIHAAAALLGGLGVDAIGFNCGLGPDEMAKLLPSLASATRLPITVNPNAGLPVVEHGRTVYKVSPDDFRRSAEALVEGGAAIIGGCCGTTPAHIAALTDAFAGRGAARALPAPRTVVSSYARAVALDDGPVLIGERINPTGKPLLKAALRENQLDIIAQSAAEQVAAGADLLDVNVGLPGIDEPSMLESAVALVQSVVDVPLVIDTAKPEAMERALRIVGGRPLVNSVNGKRQSMDAILPLVAKYGACVIALTLDDEGIPQTSEGRVKIARRIIEEAAKYGIDKSSIVVDALTLPVSAHTDNARATLETLWRVRHELGVHTVLGISNVSFGLPQRAQMNAAFLTMALARGLSACIADPLSQATGDAFVAVRSLMGLDGACARYIERFDREIAPVGDAKALTLRAAIVNGLGGRARTLANELAAHQAPVEIIDSQLIPALDEVGSAFEKGRAFLPQLLMSADAAKAAFEALRAHMGDSAPVRGKILIATVKGDIHDIGKNIVRALLENYGFGVVDLGKDVEPEAIVRRAVDEGIALVGLSALMTTTVDSMQETIRQLRAAGPFTIIVGGAVLTESYAAQIGADFYARDAMSTVRYALAQTEQA